MLDDSTPLEREAGQAHSADFLARTASIEPKPLRAAE